MSEDHSENKKGDGDQNPPLPTDPVFQEQYLASNNAEDYGRTQAERWAKAFEATARATDAVAQANAKTAEASVKSAEAAIASAKANRQMVWVSALMLIVTSIQCAYTHYSLKQSAKTLDFSIETARLDQRAWIGIKSVTLAPLEIGKKLSVNIVLSNSGKTLGKDAHTKIGLFLETVDISDPEEKKRTDPVWISYISPNGGPFFPGSDRNPKVSAKGIISAPDIPRILSGDLRIYLIGEIHYFDIFGVPHKTMMFHRYMPDIEAFNAEHIGNDAD